MKTQQQSTEPPLNESIATPGETPTRVDLRSCYRKIGISAVAAAARYCRPEKPRGHSSVSPPDRSTARGWSSARG